MNARSAPSLFSTKSELIALEAILRAHEDKRGVERLQEKRRDLGDSSVFVFIIGQGGFGKSSLINHLLGRQHTPVAAVSNLSKTWRVDLYCTSPDGSEYAIIRRYNVAGTQRLLIDEAKKECEQQEAQVLKNIKANKEHDGEGPAATFAGQIIVVNWYYTGLSTPADVVLVDTPGFFQARGSNRQHINTLSSSKGVVFADSDNPFDYYYHRANKVLWTFRADTINPRATEETLKTWSEQKKDILGIITCFDLMKTEQERKEVLHIAQNKYGSKVAGFIPVITGGKSPNLGYGIPAVQKQLNGLSGKAAAIKLEEAIQFTLNEASSSQKWMTKKGDLLIDNVTQISFYCNATSGGLLKEAKASNKALADYFRENVVPQIDASTFPAYIRTILKEASNLPALKAARTEGRPPTSEDKAKMAEFFSRNVSEKLRIPDLNKQFHNKLHYISGYIVAEGKRQSAGHHLSQIIIHQSGRIEKHKLEGQIQPPDVQNLTVAFPSLPVPVIFSSFTDDLLDLIGSLGDFASGILQMFGWQSKQEENERLMLSAIADTKHSAESLPHHIEKAMREYVQDAAHAILKSADDAVSRVYPGKDLVSLKGDAVEIDKHLDQLQSILRVAPVQDDSRYLYKTLFALWSPRDDPRRAVIDAFCEWFNKQQVEFNRDCRGWIAEVLAETLLDKNELSLVVQAYLIGTKQTQEMLRPVLASTIDQTHNAKGAGDKVYWSSQVVQCLAQKQLFNDRENFLQINFDGFELQGIASEFSKFLASEFRRHFDYHFSRMTVFVDSSKMTQFDNSKVYGFKPIAKVIGAGILSAIGCGIGEHFAGVKMELDMTTSLGVGATASVIGFAGNRLRQIRAFQRQRRETMIAAVTSELCENLPKCAFAAWQNTHPVLKSDLARQLIGQKTLIKKRALDFAMEGEFKNADF